MHSPDSISPADLDWQAVWSTHRRWLRTVVFARVGNPDVVDEVLQEVALAAARSQPALSTATAGAWLYRVAIRQSLLFRRRRARELRHVEGYGVQHAQVRSNGPLEPLHWLLADEEHQLLHEAINRLHIKDREILLLKYTEDWNCREIGERLGLSASAVATRLDRARGRLREQLRKS